MIAVPVRKVTEPAEQLPDEAQDLLAVEEPIQIRLGDRDVSITMRTPGHDEELAAGFLFTEGILRSAGDIAGIEIREDAVVVTPTEGSKIDASSIERHFYMTSSCGVCGKASIDAISAAGCTSPPADSPRVSAAVIHSLPDSLRSTQPVFERTGGLHAVALFEPEGRLVCVREDVGRHNALDKLIGRALLDGRVPLQNYVLLVSGRASFELVQKALMAGIPVMCAVGAPSSLAVETARRFGMTLAGFVRNGRFNIYSGEQRIYFSK